MKTYLKSIAPDWTLSVWRFIMKMKRTLKRYSYGGGKPFLKLIKTSDSEFQLVIDPFRNCCIDDVIAATGIWEPEITNVISRYVPPGGTFVDIGANIGYHSLYAAQLHNRSTTVYSFEPQPDLCAMLEKSIQANGNKNITLFKNALSDTAGSISLHIPKENAGGSSMLPGLIHQGEMRDVVEVSMNTLDSFSQNFARIDVMKIDVEGFELQVLKGAQQTISKHTPVLLIEFSPVIYQYSNPRLANELLAFITQLGYKTFDLHSQPFDVQTWLNAGDNSRSGQIDIVCIHG